MLSELGNVPSLSVRGITCIVAVEALGALGPIGRDIDGHNSLFRLLTGR